MNIVLFTNDEIFEPLSLFDERAKHILNILKKQAGDHFEAGIINGMAGKAHITKIDEKGIEFHFTPNNNGKPLYPISIILGFPRPIQLKRIFRDLAGLGVSNIFLIGTELGEKSYLSSTIIKEGAAYEALIDGCSQAKSTHIPSLQVYENIETCFHYLANQNEHYKNRSSIKTVLDPKEGKSSLQSLFAQNFGAIDSLLDYYYMGQNTNAPHVFLAIGSERGWTDKELSAFFQESFAPCTLGERILRTETATTTAVSIILSQLAII